MKSCILAIDIGTSGAKVMVLDTLRHTLSAKTSPYPTQSPAPGHAEQDPRLWWKAVCDALPALLRESGVSPDDIGAIGVDGVSWTPVLLDEKGDVLASAPLWYDTRSAAQCDALRNKIGEDRAFSVSGNPLQPYYEDSKILWFRENHPDVIKSCRRILSSNGYIGYCLTGNMRQDECQAYGWMFFDMEHGTWDEKLAEELNFDLSLLPPLARCAEIIGTVTPSAAEKCGLRPGIPVIAGGLDAACGAVGAGVYEVGPLHEQSGSAGGMSIVTDTYTAVKGLILSRHVVADRWLLQGGTVGGGQLMNWLISTLTPGMDTNTARDVLCAEAEAVPEGAENLIFLPYMAGERSPIWNPHACGVFFGLDFTKTRGHIVRSVLEGAAFALRHNLDAAKGANARMDLLRAVGGASRNSLWMQMKADITGVPICAVDSPHATALGCAVLAGVGSGMLKDYSAVNDYVSLNTPYEPRPDRAQRYEEAYGKYLALYPRLADLMKN